LAVKAAVPNQSLTVVEKDIICYERNAKDQSCAQRRDVRPSARRDRQSKNEEENMNIKFPIMVVDDDIVSRTVVQKHLKKACFDVDIAANGREALKLFDKKFYPIILTDWMMPEIDGPQLCQLIREKKTDGYVFILLITARGLQNGYRLRSGVRRRRLFNQTHPSGGNDRANKNRHPDFRTRKIPEKCQ
jgi:CheY-like chemotaxis protein